MSALKMRLASAAAVYLAAVSLAHADGAVDNFGKIFENSPLIYFGGGALVMERSRPSNGAIVAANPALTPTFLNGNGFKFGWDAGFEGTIGIHLWSKEALEFRFMSLNTDAQSQMTTPGSFIGAGFTGPAGTRFDSAYETKLRSWEINWRHDLFDRFTVLAGLRRIDLKDSLDISINGTVARGLYAYDNRLTGVQIGADWALLDRANPFQVNVTGKLGWYRLSADGGISEFSGNTFIGAFTTTDSGSTAAGELGISAGYRLAKNVLLRAGYQFLWLNDVALASDNAAFSLANPSLLLGTIRRGELVFQGVTFGVNVSW